MSSDDEATPDNGLPMGWTEQLAPPDAEHARPRKFWVDDYNKCTSWVHPRELPAHRIEPTDSDRQTWINELVGRKWIQAAPDGTTLSIYGSAGSLWTTRRERCLEYCSTRAGAFNPDEPNNLVVIAEEPPPRAFAASVVRTLGSSEALVEALQAVEIAEARQLHRSIKCTEEKLARAGQEEALRALAKHQEACDMLYKAQSSLSAAETLGDQAGLYAYQDATSWVKLVIQGRGGGVQLALVEQHLVEGNGAPFIRGLIRLPGTNRIDLQLTAHGEGFYRVGGAIRVTQGPNAGILGEVVEVEDPDFEATRGSKDEHHVRLDDGRVVVCQGRQIAPEWLPVHRGEGWIHHDELDGKRWPEYVALETTDARHDWPAVAMMPKRWRAVLGNEQWHVHDTSGVVTFSNIVPAIQAP